MAPSYYCSTYGKPYKDTVNITNPLGTPQQHAFFKKHTSASTRYEVQSVLDSNGTEQYLEAIRMAVSNGFVEKTYRSNNILFTPSAGSCLGNLYNRGVRSLPLVTLKLTQTSSYTKLHLFLEASSKYKDKVCVTCGQLVHGGHKS